ncbi:MAG: SIMPL domain-containing protein [Sphingomonadales bacterium]|nr:SIMPL domain-containing protein [Sphingomonadales bacterium]MBD3773693.1 SIMPL domain-containing protein [Paracoccaceae bacterium]
MTDHTEESPDRSTLSWRETSGSQWLAGAAILALGLAVGGWLTGDGLVRMREAERSVTVRGLAEREVTADLATWTLSYSATATDLQSAQASVDRDSASITAFFKQLGFPDDALQPTGVNVSQYKDQGVPQFTVRQRMTLRTRDIERAQKAAKRQVELVRKGVVLEDGSTIAYTFTKLDAIKPDMVAAATKDARAAAEQFAKDSGASVGSIRSATQGYFSIEARDGDSGGWGVNDTPYKKVRVVTSIDFALD